MGGVLSGAAAIVQMLESLNLRWQKKKPHGSKWLEVCKGKRFNWLDRPCSRLLLALSARAAFWQPRHRQTGCGSFSYKLVGEEVQEL